MKKSISITGYLILLNEKQPLWLAIEKGFGFLYYTDYCNYRNYYLQWLQFFLN